MQNENYLADWLSGKMTDEQLRQLVSAEDFSAFLKIRDTLNHSQIATTDLDQNFAAIKQKLAQKKTAETKSKKVIPMLIYAVAACLLLSLGWYQLFFLSNEMQVPSGTSKTLVLNDNSKVTLNAKSKVCYANLFQYNRNIILEGEAFFEVEKGAAFTVKTKLGNISVLGTKFNVSSFSDYFEVVCYEGKVRVESQQKSIILTQGETVRFYGSTFENWADRGLIRPLWMTGETAMEKMPMKYVFIQFENQFDVKITYPKSIESIKFTGSFTNSNMATALQSICLPLNLKYSQNTSGTIQVTE